MNGAHPVQDQHSFFVQATHDHACLHQTVEAIHQLLEATQDAAINYQAVQAVTAAIVDLQRDLREHFERGEQGGYHEEVVTLVLELVPQANQLQKQHAELLRLAEEMVADAQCGDQPVDVWNRLKTDYTRFAKQLLAHESAENCLLERVFNEDLGGDV
jgi:hypothetical protein